MRHGMVEYFLCHDCEQKFGALEDYAKKFFYGTSSPLRLQLPLLEDPLFLADYKKMKLFQLSILWRAAESKGEFFSAVDLDDNHKERLRQMLANGDPGREHQYFCAMTRLVVVSAAITQLQAEHGISNETGFFAPISRNHGTWDSYTFVMGGLVWSFCVSEQGVPEVLANTYIKENGQFWLMSMPADGFLTNFCRKAVEAGNVTKADAEGSMSAKLRWHPK